MGTAFNLRRSKPLHSWPCLALLDRALLLPSIFLPIYTLRSSSSRDYLSLCCPNLTCIKGSSYIWMFNNQEIPNSIQQSILVVLENCSILDCQRPIHFPTTPLSTSPSPGLIPMSLFSMTKRRTTIRIDRKLTEDPHYWSCKYHKTNLGHLNSSSHCGRTLKEIPY